MTEKRIEDIELSPSYMAGIEMMARIDPIAGLSDLTRRLIALREENAALRKIAQELREQITALGQRPIS